MKVITLYTDGASRGNPGSAASAWLIMDGVDVLEADSMSIGIASNNMAEYTALLTALKHAVHFCNPKETAIEVFSDSELMVNQLNGLYAIKSPNLSTIHQEVGTFARIFSSVTYTHVPRENPYISSCDWMCNHSLDLLTSNVPPKKEITIQCTPIGFVHSSYKTIEETPRMGRLANEISIIELDSQFASATYGLKEGSDIFVLCWFDRSDRTILQVNPRGDSNEKRRNDILGVFATRSPARPNPISLTLVKLVALEGTKLSVRGLEALDNTPVLDIKPWSPEFDVPDNSLS